MKHDATTEQATEFLWVATCACGHESVGPNLDTTEKRHQIHERIQDARAALRGDNDA